jgi:maltooligosyltrehalose trehalohydrolase
VLEQPFLYAGDYSSHRNRKHGAPPEGLSGDRFVVCLQNHDQVGNRALGGRLNTLLRTPSQQRLAASLLLLSPHLPLLFMGEEYGEENPFPFFCSFGDASLVQAVREGRKREFAAFAWQGEVPDPHAEETFTSARLSWSWPEGSARAGLRCLHADLLAARREWPALRDFVNRTARLLPEGEAAILELIRSQTMTAFFNLTGEPQSLPTDGRERGALRFSSEFKRYGGSRAADADVEELLPYECMVFGEGRA